MKRLIKALFPSVRWLQPLYEKMYYLSIHGMNFNSLGDFAKSGELNALRYVVKKVGVQKGVYMDVGANKGSYTRLLQKELPGKRLIYAFEPLRICYEPLKDSCSPDPTVSVLKLGFGAEKEKKSIYYSPEQSTIASFFRRDVARHGMGMSEEESVDVSTIDDFVCDHEIEIIHLLKLDVEGNEYNCLLGAEKSLNEGKIRFIQFEFGGTQIDARHFFKDYWDMLSSHYRIYRIVRNGLRRIASYDESREIFHACNYLAELK